MGKERADLTLKTRMRAEKSRMKLEKDRTIELEDFPLRMAKRSRYLTVRSIAAREEYFMDRRFFGATIRW